MTYRSLLAGFLTVTLLGVVGCNSNPGAPSAPRITSTEGIPDSPPPEAQKSARGSVSGPAPSSLE